jgi:signal transduction histidine kinase
MAPEPQPSRVGRLLPDLSRPLARPALVWAVLPSIERLLVAMRGLLVALAFVVSAGSGSLPRLLLSWVFLLVLALVMSWMAQWPTLKPRVALAEALLTVVISTSVLPVGPLSLYLLAPVLSAGLSGGYRWALGTAGGAVVLGTVLTLIQHGTDDFISALPLVQWGVLAAALGVMGAWVQSEVLPQEDPAERDYAEAVSLLIRLEPLSRQLPRGLEVGTVALDVLREITFDSAIERCLLLVPELEGALTVVAGLPDTQADWLPLDLEDVSTVVAGQPSTWIAVSSTTHVIPLRMQGPLLAVVAIQTAAAGQHPPDTDGPDDIERITIPLYAALLFDRIRFAAANEERDRIAREIHDGIAQDVAYLGYAVDGIVESATDDDTREAAELVRDQISRVVGEIRASVFELRQVTPSSTTLGSALSEYAHRQFDDSPVSVHVLLNESPHRLIPVVETELLRIGKEAVTNVRRHADARNLWLECQVTAPRARVVVADDGVGIGERSPDSFGLDIMAERAVRIGASLEVEHRRGGGTVVTVEV